MTITTPQFLMVNGDPSFEVGSAEIKHMIGDDPQQLVLHLVCGVKIFIAPQQTPQGIVLKISQFA